MSVAVLVAALAVLLGAAVGTAAARSSRRGLQIGAAVGAGACAAAAGASAALLLSGSERTIRLAWSPPVNALAFGIDPLSVFFLLCIFTVGGLASLYALGYFAAAAQPSAGSAIAWLHGLIAAMAMVVLARDVVAFLVAWEALFLTSYFLVTFDDHAADVGTAGFTYLIASHIGVVFLFILFGVLMRHAGNLDFAAFTAAPLSGAPATLAFGIALVGFGIKAGVWPLHGWLPEAHPAAPTPVSALMSGVMIKMGIYGLLRTLTFLGPPPAWWGASLVAIGGVSALAGVLLALAQHDLKRLLAYHSVENIGIITIGIGVGLLGVTAHAPGIAVAGFAGALLHTLNHGLFKGLLFQAAGALALASGSRKLEAHGGLLRRMPTTGGFFLIGAAAISGLPPLNGFVSEWLIYLGALGHGLLSSPRGAGLTLLVVPVLALVGGLAAACFVKVFGIVFLGEPRSAASAAAHEVGMAMRVSMGLGAAACLGIGTLPAMALRLIAGPVTLLAGASSPPAGHTLAAVNVISLVAVLFGATAAVVALGRRWLLRSREVHAAVTWDCGYSQPTPRMQYTAVSFASPVLEPFQGLLHARRRRIPVTGYFPRQASEDLHFEDPGEGAVRWVAAAVIAPLTRVRALQRGPVQLYLLYILVTLLLLLVWQVRT